MILEGTQRADENLGVSREAMQGALITMSLVYGIPILRARNLEETARLINYIAQQFDEIAQGASALQKIAGIGEKIAQKIRIAVGD